jgi:hypothetical protein
VVLHCTGCRDECVVSSTSLLWPQLRLWCAIAPGGHKGNPCTNMMAGDMHGHGNLVYQETDTGPELTKFSCGIWCHQEYCTGIDKQAHGATVTESPVWMNRLDFTRMQMHMLALYSPVMP